MGYNYNYYYYHSSIPYEPKVGYVACRALGVMTTSKAPRSAAPIPEAPSCNPTLNLKPQTLNP